MGASKTLLLSGHSTAGFAEGCSPSIFLIRSTFVFKVIPTPLALTPKHRGQRWVIGGLRRSTQAEGQICVVFQGCWRPLPCPCWWSPRCTGGWGVRAQWPARCVAAACSWGQGESGIEVCAGLHRADWLPVLWPPHSKSWLIGKDSDAGRDWGQEEKGMTEDEMAGWHHWLDGRESGWTPGVGDGQGGLPCCDSWGHKESDTTEWLNWTDWLEVAPLGLFSPPSPRTPAYTPIPVPLCRQSWGALTIRESAKNMKILLNSPCKQKVHPTILWLDYTEKCDFIFSISFYIWKESGCSVWEEMGVAHLGCYWRCCPSINLLIWGLMGHVIPEKATSLSEE